MDKPISKLLVKLKLTDAGSVKFNSSKKKQDSNNSNNSNANAGVVANGGGGSTLPPGPGQFSLAPSTTNEPAGGRATGGGMGIAPSPLLATPSAVGAVPPDGEQQLHPSTLAQLRRPSPKQRASCYLGEGVDSHLRRESGLGPDGDPLGLFGSKASLNQRRYSLELQQLVKRQQLLSQPPPHAVPPLYPAAPGYGSAQRGAGGCLGEQGYFSEPERHKRFSLQEALFYKRLSTGSDVWENPRPASLSHPPHRPSDITGGGMATTLFYPPGPALSPCSSFSLQESVLVSPRSSFASSTASGGGGGSPMGSCCSSNRTSGISLGYDSRYSASSGLAPPPPQTVAPGGSVAAYGATGRAGVTPVEAWTQYLDGGVRPGTNDSRHSYPPAVGSPAATCYQGGPEWWDEQQAAGKAKEAGVMGERARYSDLPGTRYQEELTRLLLRDAAREGGGLLEGLRLKDQPLALSTLSKAGAVTTTGSSSAGGGLKPQEDSGPAATETRQEFFGEIFLFFVITFNRVAFNRNG